MTARERELLLHLLHAALTLLITLLIVDAWPPAGPVSGFELTRLLP